MHHKIGKIGRNNIEKGRCNGFNGDHVVVSFHVHIRHFFLFFYMFLSANRNLLCFIQTGIHFAFVQISTSGSSEIGESTHYSIVEKVNNGLIQRISPDTCF